MPASTVGTSPVANAPYNALAFSTLLMAMLLSRKERQS